MSLIYLLPEFGEQQTNREKESRQERYTCILTYSNLSMFKP